MLANDFGLNDFGPIIFVFYLFIGFRRKKKRREMCVVLKYVYLSMEPRYKKPISGEQILA